LGLFGASTLAFGVTAAQAASVTVGSPTQTNNQSATTGQLAAQNVGGGVIVGDTSQSGKNSSSTELSNTQKVGGGGAVVVGSPSQNNSQTAGTSQTLDQQTPPATGPGGVHIGNTTQSGLNSSSTEAENTQKVGGGGGCFFFVCSGAVIVGSPAQSNTQNIVTGQLIAQNAGGVGGVIVGGVSQSAKNSSSSEASNTQKVGGGFDAVLVGNPVQHNGQTLGTSQVIGQGAAGGVIVGGALGVSQSQLNSSCQDVSSTQNGGGTDTGCSG